MATDELTPLLIPSPKKSQKDFYDDIYARLFVYVINLLAYAYIVCILAFVNTSGKPFLVDTAFSVKTAAFAGSTLFGILNYVGGWTYGQMINIPPLSEEVITREEWVELIANRISDYHLCRLLPDRNIDSIRRKKFFVTYLADPSLPSRYSIFFAIFRTLGVCLVSFMLLVFYAKVRVCVYENVTTDSRNTVYVVCVFTLLEVINFHGGVMSGHFY